MHGRLSCPLTDAGYWRKVVYQPAHRFSPLRWAETGLYQAASAVVAGFTSWWVRRAHHLTDQGVGSG